MHRVTYINCFLIILFASSQLPAEVVIFKDWYAVKGTFKSGDSRVLKISEENTNKELIIRLSDISYIIEESYLDPETLKNYRNIDWKNFDFTRIEKSREQLECEKAEPDKSYFKLYSPRIGIYTGYSIPAGNMGSVINPGYSALLFNDYKIPITPIDFRAGFMAGYTYYSVDGLDLDAWISLLPFVAYGEISHMTQSGLIPYFRLGTGITRITLTDNSDSTEKLQASSFDPTLLIGAGTGYITGSLPSLEFFIDLSYMRIFEEISGDIFNISMGVAYHFYTARSLNEISNSGNK